MKGCCFTGYRPSKMPFPLVDGNEQYDEFYKNARQAIEDAIADGCDTFYNGGAVGFDIITAEIVLDFKKEYDVSLIIVVPHPKQADAFTPEWYARYKNCVENADEVITTCDHYHKGVFQIRNEYMVDRSERVITYYDGQKGGTGNTIRYAKKHGKQIVNLAPFAI